MTGLSIISLLASMLTAAVGVGGGVVMLAVLAQVVPTKAVIPIHAVVQVGSNVSRAILFFSNLNASAVAFFASGSVLGALLGVQVVLAVPAAVLQVLISLFILYAVWLSPLTGLPANRAMLMFGGMISTVLTFFVGATGPFVVALLKPYNMPFAQMQATSAAAMTVQHGLKIAAFGFFGFVFWPYVPALVAMICMGFLGTWIGKRMSLKIDVKKTQIALNIMLSLLALRLLWQGIQTILQ